MLHDKTLFLTLTGDPLLKNGSRTHGCAVSTM